MHAPELGPNVAGTWYPGDAGHLARTVDGLLSEAGGGTSHPAAAIIAPHAGLAYSGTVASAAFRRLVGTRAERVLLIGPSHYMAFAGGALPRAGGYRTPLGRVDIDTEAIDELVRVPGVLKRDDRPFLREHSLEAEIPFLQRALEPGWRLLPVCLGTSGAGDLERVADALRPAIGGGTVVVASSDFTHFGPRFEYVPFDEDLPRKIRELDHGAIGPILAGDVTGFEAYVARTGATICGRAAIGVLLRLIGRSCAASLAAYDTSGRMTGSWDHSVSYASVVFEPATAEGRPA